MQNSAKKPVAIITGASRGVGAATALLLASKGWNVTITCSSTIKEAKEVAKACETFDVEALAIQADVSDDTDCKNTIEQTVKKWGRIDALINNAGTTKFAWDHSNLDLLDAEDFQKVYGVNLIGPFQMIKASKEFLMKSDNPSITNVSSIAGIKGIGSSLAYAASKGALNTMTISMARNLGPIRVNAIFPGFIDGEWLKVALGEDLFNTAKTNLESSVPLKSVATPETIAESILAFISLNKNATGQLLILDGGHHLSL